MKEKLYAIMPCGGHGSRMKADKPKQYLEVSGKPLFFYTLNTLISVKSIDKVIVAIAEGDSFFQSYQTALEQEDLDPSRYQVVRCAGDTRAQTVENTLNWLATQMHPLAHDWVMVHDAARCLIDPKDIENLISEGKTDTIGAILAVPLADTLKSATNASDGSTRIAHTLDRNNKWLAQTPQMFRFELLQKALRHAQTQNLPITDEASAVEALHLHPKLVKTQGFNIKVTYPEDLELARLILSLTRLN